MEPPLPKVGTVRMVTVLVAALAVGAALGCGSDDDQRPDEQDAPAVSGEQRAILSTIGGLQTASRRGDARKICNEIFTERLAESIPDPSNRGCEKEVRATFASPDMQLSIGRQMQIRGARATVTVLDEDGRTSRFVLVKRGERWQVDRIKAVKS